MSSQNLILLQPFDDGKCGLFGGTDGELIAIVETQESAERLLIAWNAHDDLVAALQLLLAKVDYVNNSANAPERMICTALHIDVIDQSHAALKKATSQP